MEPGAESDAQRDETVSPELIATAYHEAGHAVMAVLQGRLVHKLTIVPGKSAFGHKRLGLCEMGKGRSKASRDHLEEEVLILYAGMVAEAHFTGEYCEAGALQDLAVASRILESRANSQSQLERLQRRLLDKTEHLLADEEHAEAVRLVAGELLRRTTISGRSVRHFCNQAIKQD